MRAPVGGVDVLPLRDYQDATLEALIADWRGGLRRLAAVLPTGAGKTVIFAHLAKRVLAAGGRVGVLVHRDELIRQAADKLHSVMPGEPVGVIKGTRREYVGRRIVVASVLSLARERSRAEFVRWGPSLMIVDECHHAPATTYMNILRDVGAFDQGAIVAGFTATLQRADGVALGEVWEKVSHTVSIVDLIRRRYLLNVRARRVHVEGLDLGRVKVSRGDYAEGDLGEAMMKCLAPAAIARAYVEHAGERQGIIFMPTVQTAYAMADELRAVGITAVCVEGSTAPDDRERAIEDSRDGRVQVLTNCMLFTEGTDLPWIDVGVIGRPTKSAPLFVQMAGRILRPWPGQETALLLDVVGVGARHRLATLASLTGAERIEKLADDLSDDELAELDLLGLAELEDDRSGAGAADPEMVDGRLDSYEFELFAGSHRTWLQTDRGVWFIQAGTGSESRVIFLVPVADGHYSVAEVPARAAGGSWVVQNVDMSYAMSWGEKRAGDIGGYINRKADWRRERPSDGQRREATRLGVIVPADATRGAMSDALSIRNASLRVDHLPMVAGVTKRS